MVSVVIPMYNGEKFVGDAIRSVLSQSYAHAEVVAINDGSPDNSSEIATSFGERVTVIDQPNQGVAAARNAGILSCLGEFVAFLDQDDWWAEEKLELQMTQFSQDPDVGLVHTDVTYYDESGTKPQPILNEHAGTLELTGYCLEQLLLGNGMYNSTVVVRRAALDEAGLCDLSIPGNTVQDYDLWLRIAKSWKFAVIPERVSKLRLHDDQGIWDRTAMLEAELGVLLKNRPRKLWKGPNQKSRLQELFDSIAVSYRDKGEFRKGRKYFRQAFAAAPNARAFFRWAGSYVPPSIISALKRDW